MQSGSVTPLGSPLIWGAGTGRSVRHCLLVSLILRCGGRLSLPSCAVMLRLPGMQSCSLCSEEAFLSPMGWGGTLHAPDLVKSIRHPLPPPRPCLLRAICPCPSCHPQLFIPLAVLGGPAGLQAGAVPWPALC